MKRFSLVLLVAFAVGFSTMAVAADEEEYASAMKVFRSSPVVEKFYNNSYGYAVFPNIGKAGFVIGGSYGTGRVYQDHKLTGTSKVIKGSIGFQAGAKVFSQIVFFEDKRAYDEFTSGNFEFDATAQAIVITAGGEAQVGTGGKSAGATAGPKTGVQMDTTYVRGLATFVHAKGGLMYEASIGGQKFTFDPL